MAIDKYGIQNFKKEILCVCNNEKECYEKEKELIKLFNANNSDLFYNITPGGPHIEGFKLSEKEKRRMYLLKAQLADENIYGMKVGSYINPDNGKYSEHIELIELIPRKQKCYIHQIFNNYTRTNSVGNLIDKNINITAPKIFNKLSIGKDNMVSYLHDNGYQLISELEYYRTENEAEHSDEWRNKLEEVRRSNKLYFEKLGIDTSCMDKTKKISNSKSITIIKNDSSSIIVDDNDTIRYIKEHASTSKDIGYLLKLYEEYNGDFGFAIIFNAVTGLASMPAGYLKTKFKCSQDQYKKAKDLLDYEKRFIKIVDKMKGRRDYFFAMISFCYECKGFDADRLFNKIKDNYKDLVEIESIKSLLQWITPIYNHYLSPNKKIYFDLKYDIWKSQQR